MQPHYIYSPREMTRWVRGIYEALKPLETLPIEGLVRVWAHEALRLFQDRLVHDEERLWTDENVNNVALKHFPSVDTKVHEFDSYHPCFYVHHIHVYMYYH
jgi:dynein heavy chain 1